MHFADIIDYHYSFVFVCVYASNSWFIVVCVLFNYSVVILHNLRGSDLTFTIATTTSQALTVLVRISLVNRIYWTHLIGQWSLTGSGSGSEIWTSLMIKLKHNCCGASEPEASERSSSLICAERGFWTKFYLAHGIVVVRAFYAQNKNFKLARVFEFLSNF
jgi:hypothetical protein